MARKHNPYTIAILKFLSTAANGTKINDIKQACGPKLSAKDFYNYLFRLAEQEYITKNTELAQITEEGSRLLGRLKPAKDGVWKLVIFDIPEKHKYVRSVLRGKLKQLHFKKWQNSIWVSPYALEPEIEKEFDDLGKKFFVRLIKTTEINNVEDLEKLFKV
jgi:DNA-binding transcriptional regulator PaaX